MQSYKKNKIKSITDFFKKTAHKPFGALFSLLMVAAGASFYVYYIFQNPGISEGEGGAAADNKAVFNAAKIKSYREIFGLLEKREKDYLGSSDTVFPKVFIDPKDINKKNDPRLSVKASASSTVGAEMPTN